MKRTIFVSETIKHPPRFMSDTDIVKAVQEAEIKNRERIATDLGMPDQLRRFYTWFFVHNIFPHDIVFKGTSGELNYVALESSKKIGALTNRDFCLDLSLHSAYHQGLDFYVIYHDENESEARRLMESWNNATDSLDSLLNGYAHRNIENAEKQGLYNFSIIGSTKRKYTPDKAGLILVLDPESNIIEELAYPVDNSYTEKMDQFAGNPFFPKRHTEEKFPRLQSRYRQTLLSDVSLYHPEPEASKFLFVPNKRFLIEEGNNEIILLG